MDKAKKVKEFIRSVRDKLFGNYEWIVDFTGSIRPRDVKKAKVSSIIGYIFFFVPMIMHDDNQFARFHCNQSILNLALSTIVSVLLSMIPYVGPYLMALQEILCVIWMIRGMIYAARGKAVGIPLVGWITILAYRYPGQ